MLRPLVEEHGPSKVRRMGIEVLGFPPDVFALCFTYEEFRKLSAALAEAASGN